MKVGVITYVHGWYIDYIPFFIYSILQAYPDYKIKVFIRETIPDSVKFNLSFLPVDRFEIIEEYLSNFGIRDDPSKKPYYLRWLIPYCDINEFDYAFICDVDFLMISENPTMADQRLDICNHNKVPFANYQRDPHPNYPSRITGWHFIKVHEYYEKTGQIIDALRNQDIDITKMKNKYSYKNGLGETQWGQESLLYYIIRESFGDIDLSKKFPTHHGIHLGPIRANLHLRLYNNDPTIVDKFGMNAKYWYSEQARKLARDPIICEMINKLPNNNVKLIMTRFSNDLNNVNF